MADTNVKIIVDAVDKASGVLGGIGGALQGIGKAGLVLAGGAVVAGIGAVGTGLGIAVDEAMEAQEGTAQLNAVLKSTGGIAGVTQEMALGLASSLQSTTKFTDDEVLAGENLLLTFTGIGSDVFPQATSTLLDMATAMGTDAKAGAIQLGKALNDPTVGIGALSRVGVVFTEEQKAQVKAMQEAGDMAGAQGIILAELQKEFGGSAEAAGKTLPGQMTILKNSLYDTLGQAGEVLLPMFTSALTGITPIITQVFTGIATFLASEGFRQFLTDVGNFLTGQVVPAIMALATWIGVNLPPVIAFLSNLWTTVLQPALATVVNILLTVVFPALAQLGQWLGVQIPAFIAFLKGIWETNFLGIQTIFTTVWNTIKLAWQAIKQLLQGDFTGFGETVRAMFDGVLKAITGLISSAIGFFKGIDWGQVGSDIVHGIANGITAAVDWVKAAIINLGGAVLAAIKGFLGITSPSRVMAEMVGKPMAQGIAMGFQTEMRAFDITPTISRGGGAMRQGLGQNFAGQPLVMVYSPMFSTLDKKEIENKLTPIVRKINRKL